MIINNTGRKLRSDSLREDSLTLIQIKNIINEVRGLKKSEMTFDILSSVGDGVSSIFRFKHQI